MCQKGRLYKSRSFSYINNMVNVKIIRGEDGRFEYIKDSYYIQFRCIVDVADDNKDISDWPYNSALAERIPLFEIWYTYVKYPDFVDVEPEEINENIEVFLGDTVIFAGERVEVVEPEFDKACPHMSDFFMYVRKLTATIANNYSALSAINRLT